MQQRNTSHKNSMTLLHSTHTHMKHLSCRNLRWLHPVFWSHRHFISVVSIKKPSVKKQDSHASSLVPHPSFCHRVWGESGNEANIFIHERIPSASTSAFESHPHWKFSTTKFQMQQCDCNTSWIYTELSHVAKYNDIINSVCVRSCWTVIQTFLI